MRQHQTSTGAAPRPDDQRARAPATDPGPSHEDVRLHLMQLHVRLGALAADLARTEEDVAGTLERVARTRPSAESRLREQAASARQYAAYLQFLARKYGADNSTWN